MVFQLGHISAMLYSWSYCNIHPPWTCCCRRCSQKQWPQKQHVSNYLRFSNLLQLLYADATCAYVCTFPRHVWQTVTERRVQSSWTLCLPDLVGITAGPLNTLHRHDRRSGVGLWTLQLDSPAVAVHLADGTSLKLHGSAVTADNTSSVVVGILHSSMYALPVAADWLQSGLPAASNVSAAIHFEPEPENTITGSDTLPHAVRGPQQPATLGPQDHRGTEPAQHAQHDFESSSENSRAAEANGAIKAAAGPEGKGRKADTERLKGQGERPGPEASTALMQLPQKAGWASPVSLHSVVTNNAPQSFLPNLTDAKHGGEAGQQPTQATQWTGENKLASIAALTVSAPSSCTSLTCIIAQHCIFIKHWL